MPKRVSLKGKGADLFFGDYPAAPGDEAASPPIEAPESLDAATMAVVPRLPSPMSPSPPADEPPDAPTRKPPRSRRPAIRSASTLAHALASQHDSTLVQLDADTVESIRQVIKAPGREVSFVRLTPEEKAHLSDIVYTYKRQGQKTSETEINRIAINYLLLDYHEHGEQSVLARVLAALRA